MPQKQVQYPAHYTDEDKALYDDLIARGDALIGKKLNENERFLLDISARITINQLRNYNEKCFNDEEIEEMRKIHKEYANAGIIETPSEMFYEDVIMLSDGTSFKHPLTYPEEYYNEMSLKKPDENDKEIVNITDITDNIILE
jgi:hypothetical protein